MTNNPGETHQHTDCADCLWEQAQSLSQAAHLIARWLRGELPHHPGHHGPPAPETATLTEPLLTLAACGILTVGSQPGLSTPNLTQRAYLDLIGPTALVDHIGRHLTSLRQGFRWYAWSTRTRPAPPPYPVDMIVTAVRRTVPADPADPYLQAWTAEYLDPDDCTRSYPPGADPADGDVRHADMTGLDPRTWERATRARSGWTTQDVLGRLHLTPPAGQDLLATPDLATALHGSRSMTLVDTAWGEPDRLVRAVADAATQWQVDRTRHLL